VSIIVQEPTHHQPYYLPNQKQSVGQSLLICSTIFLIPTFYHRILRPLVLRLRGRIVIYVKGPSYTLTLEVKESNTVGFVKQKIEELEGIPSSNFNLIFGFQVLNNENNTLAEYHIRHNDKLLLYNKIKTDI
jgi:Ubiquitin family